jgi:hypothetical protein
MKGYDEYLTGVTGIGGASCGSDSPSCATPTDLDLSLFYDLPNQKGITSQSEEGKCFI